MTNIVISLRKERATSTAPHFIWYLLLGNLHLFPLLFHLLTILWFLDFISFRVHDFLGENGMQIFFAIHVQLWWTISLIYWSWVEWAVAFREVDSSGRNISRWSWARCTFAETRDCRFNWSRCWLLWNWTWLGPLSAMILIHMLAESHRVLHCLSAYFTILLAIHMCLPVVKPECALIKIFLAYFAILAIISSMRLT